MATSGTTDAGTTKERRPLTGWRAKLPRIPDPVDVELGVAPKKAFNTWLTLSVAILAAGIGLNWYLTDGTWMVPESVDLSEANVFGATRTQFLTTHPYDVVTAVLFVAANLFLAVSLLKPAEGTHRPGLVGRDLALTWLGIAAAGAIAYWGYHTYGATTGVVLLAGFATIVALFVLGARFFPWLARRPGMHRFLSWMGKRRHPVRAIGWTVFGAHWAMTAVNLYYIEDGDVVNALFAATSVFVLTYFAYQEFISKRLGEDNASLRFAAGAVVIASTVWYAFLRVEVLAEWLIETVAGHTMWLLGVLGQDVRIGVDDRTGFVSAIDYPAYPGRTVIIILACTAIQSMMIFVSAALAVSGAKWKNRLAVIGVTVPVVYFLNLLRNAGIIFGWETRWLEKTLGISQDAAFSLAHNWLGKVGSLIALVFIAIYMFAVLPQVVAAVVGILDLPRRRGPIEQHVRHLRGRNEEPPLRSADTATATSAPERNA
ncbi:MAG: archaeosortase A [Euryarchaeota archaeon]|nr:archaeosortase A [Euryarchaeota archaeon]